jgi:hypothetical protein
MDRTSITVLEVLAQPFQRAELGDAHRQLGLRFLGRHLRVLVGQRAFGLFLGGADRGLVDVLRTHRGVGQDRDQLRLHLEDAAGNGEVERLAARLGHHHLARLEPGDQRRMARRNAQFAHFAGGHDHLGLAVEDFMLGADDVATDGGCHVFVPA